uniref:Uncharacterized protein n=1 Tax=Ditylenchus dipsaci TaxID=166011 RepID=A0A915DTS5_9BILA
MCIVFKPLIFLRYYARIDDSFPILCVLVKSWAKVQGIAGGFQGTLNGISLVLMVLHFMQVGTSTPVLPNLQGLYPYFLLVMLHLRDSI